MSREAHAGEVQQGSLLIGLLVVSAFGNVIAVIYTAVLLFSSTNPRTLVQIVDGAIVLIGFVTSVLALWAIWKWRKWGVYTYFAVSGGFLLLSALAGLLSLRSFIALAILVGLAWAIRKQWTHFR